MVEIEKQESREEIPQKKVVILQVIEKKLSLFLYYEFALKDI